MVSPLLFYQLALIVLVWLCLMLQWAWPSARTLSPTTPEPPPPRLKRHRVPKPFRGLATKPHCDACCLLYTSPSPRDRQKSRMPSSA